MSLDSIHYKKIENLQGEIIEYINNIYLRKIREDKVGTLIDQWNKKSDMLDKISISFAIEGNFKLKNISEEKLNKEINRVLFDEYIDEAFDSLKEIELRIATEEKINIKVNRKRLEVMIKDHLRKNIITIFNRDDIEFKGIILVNNEEELEIIKIQ
ncbi:MAG: hypothetical protein ACRC28_03930 [Clostridium sp.]|uniref:hypothetical protein n=1 Tax=Clostridium sp. TaxID=1506 RepID=UPI003F2B2281